MAVLTPETQFAVQWRDGLADTAVLYALRNVTTADTADVSGQFSAVKRAVVIATTTDRAAQAAVVGTVVTMPNNLAAEAGWMLVWGVHA